MLGQHCINSSGLKDNCILIQMKLGHDMIEIYTVIYHIEVVHVFCY